MRIQAATGVALLALLFISALMEAGLWDATADRFFFANHESAGNDRMTVIDFENAATDFESAQASLAANPDRGARKGVAE